MNGTTARALKGDEIRNSRYLDALHAFRTHTGLCMTQGAPEGGGAAGDGGGAGDGQQQQQQQQSAQQQQQQQQGSADKGFPENTPVVEMTPTQQAAYYKHQAQKHEDRNKALLQITGGKHGDDLKAVLDEYGQLKSASQTDAEKAIEDAKKQARAETAIESVRAAFDLVLPADMAEEKKNSALEVLNLAAFLTPDGKVDTAKVRTHAAALAGKGNEQQQQRRDWGGGNRQTSGQPLGAAGAAEAARRFPQKSTTTS